MLITLKIVLVNLNDFAKACLPFGVAEPYPPITPSLEHLSNDWVQFRLDLDRTEMSKSADSVIGWSYCKPNVNQSNCSIALSSLFDVGFEGLLTTSHTSLRDAFSSVSCTSSPNNTENAQREADMVSSPSNSVSDCTEYATQSHHEHLAGVTSHILDRANIEYHIISDLQDTAVPTREDKTTTADCRRSVVLEPLRQSRHYKDITVRNDDGLFHCPWEGQPSCSHKPQRLKCRLE